MNMKLPILLSTLSIASVLGQPLLTAWSTPTLIPQTSPEIPSLKTDPSGLNLFSDLAARAVPAVVNLSVSVKRQAAFRMGGMDGFDDDDPFQGFFNRQRMPGMPQQPKEVALGTGFVIDASGILVTNNHVVSGADEVEIQLTESESEKPIKGKVIGRDPDLDVALVKFTPPGKLTALPLGDSDALKVGEYVMAVGNPYGHGHSVSHGIVSAKDRALPGIPLANYLQTDAPINPGNSGGPLLNTRGEVIGINNAIDARAQGISYAIPINYVKKILPQLKLDGKVSRGYIGATIAPLTPEIAEKLGESKELKAALVTDTQLGGPAARAGIRPYDIITSVGSEEVHSPSDLIQKVTSTSVGSKIPLTVLREGKKLKLDVKVASRPGEEVVSQR